MIVGIVGLGLIGGSVAKAYKKEKHNILAFDTDKVMLDYAIMTETVDGVLTKENIKECDLVFLCLYPEASAEYLKDMAEYMAINTLVIDCCGTKRKICQVGFALAEKYGFTFVGGHPMAGTHNSGFKYSKEDMFEGAPMVVVPHRFDDIALLDRVKKLLAPMKLGAISITTAEKHDRMIAFTSQMAHIVSNAYVKSPEAVNHKGFSAGSYKDLTRVAWLNPVMWAELFIENKDNVLNELDILIENLVAYKNALENDDKEVLTQILDEGRRIKGEIDG